MSGRQKSSDKLNHITISYDRSDSAMCVKIKNGLEKFGYRVWMDVRQLNSGSVNSITRAIEESSAVLICVNEKYRQSLNAQLEALHARRIKKLVVPLIFEKGYENSRGWLEPFMNNVFINFAVNDFDECMRQLIDEFRSPSVAVYPLDYNEDDRVRLPHVARVHRPVKVAPVKPIQRTVKPLPQFYDSVYDQDVDDLTDEDIYETKPKNRVQNPNNLVYPKNPPKKPLVVSTLPVKSMAPKQQKMDSQRRTYEDNYEIYNNENPPAQPIPTKPANQPNQPKTRKYNDNIEFEETPDTSKDFIETKKKPEETLKSTSQKSMGAATAAVGRAEAKSKPAALSMPKSVDDWSEEDVRQWLIENKLEPELAKKLASCTGKDLRQLSELKKNAPEFFYSTLNSSLNFNQMKPILKFSDSLGNLFTT